MAVRRPRQNCGSRACSFAASIGRWNAAPAHPSRRRQPPRDRRVVGSATTMRRPGGTKTGTSRRGAGSGRHPRGRELRPSGHASSLTPRGALICSRRPKRLKFQEVSSPRRDASDAVGRHREWWAIRNSGLRTRLRVRTESGSATRCTSTCQQPREMRSQRSGSAPMGVSWAALSRRPLARATRTCSGPSDVGFLSAGRRSVAARALQRTRSGWFLGDGWSR